MQLTVNPLIVAAALGLLGPAALADDETGDLQGVAGVWTRVLADGIPSDGPSEFGLGVTPGGSANSGAAISAAPVASGAMGDTIEVIPVDDLLVLDDGTGTTSSWQRLDDAYAVHELQVDGAKIRRTLAMDGDDLLVDITVTRDGVTDEYSERYARSV
jgi:hypothetical protein